MGLGGNDSLSGGNGNDTLNGGTGNDTMIGGAGNDIYIVDSSNDVVTEALNQGTDLVNSSITYTLGANLENLTLTGTTNINGTGNTLNNNITGNSGNNILNGGVGNDFLDGGTGINTLNGGDGNDTLIPATGNSVDDGSTVNGGTGTDTLIVDFSNANFEDLNYDGLGIYNHGEGINSRFYDTRLLTISNVEIFNIIGTPYNDHFTVEEGDSFDGSGGYDTLSLNFATATGNVQINFAQTANQVTYNNTVVKNFENIGTVTTGSGNDSINLGNGSGVDDGGTVNGNGGTDTLIVDFSNADFEDLNYDGLGIYNHSEGINSRYYDTRLLTISNVEIFNIKGTLYNDHFTVEEGDSFDGSAGYDTLNLNFATATGIVQVNFNQTTNQVTYNNTTVKNFENIGTVRTGSGNDVINLGSGNGVDDNGTVNGNGGTDTLIVNFSNANFEDLNYDGLGIYNHGEGINSRYYDTRLLTISNVEIFNITGTAYNDNLVGEEGDTLDGGAGYDTLSLNFATATGNVQVNFNQTTNQVTYNNTTVKNFENIGTVRTGSGNDVINLGSGSGVDDNGTVNGNGGTDTLIVNFSNANFEDLNYDGLGIYNHGEGINSRYYDNRLLTISNVEVFNITGTPYADDLRGFGLNDTLNGGNDDDILNGFAGNDSIDGGNGADTMIGGAGNDIYTVNSTGDRITENVNEGTDTVQSSITYTLGNNLENLILTGSNNINGIGNALNNVITGNSGNNTLNGGDGNDSLDGGVGVDTLIGGNGNDTYIVDNVGDVITESLNAGTDSVNSSVTYTLAVNVENLTLTGTGNINGTGNTLNNVITGNIGNNTLNGGDGNDSLDGGVGNDTLVGGNGNDTYIVDNVGDVVTEALNAGTDSVNSSVTYTLAVNIENLTLTGTGNINGTGNALANRITGNSGNNTLNGGDGNDTLNGGVGNDTLVGGKLRRTCIVYNHSMTNKIVNFNYVH